MPRRAAGLTRAGPAWVVKLGGGLFGRPELRRVARHIARVAPPPIVVPGGGPFADQVRAAQRRWAFADETAHQMALLALSQYARILAEFAGLPAPRESPPGPRSLHPPCVWAPGAATRRALRGRDWSFTSDSVAAWLALRVGADWLTLVKPVGLERVAAPRDLVDAAFPGLVAGSGLRVALVDAAQWLRLRGAADCARHEARF